MGWPDGRNPWGNCLAISAHPFSTGWWLHRHDEAAKRWRVWAPPARHLWHYWLHLLFMVRTLRRGRLLGLRGIPPRPIHRKGSGCTTIRRSLFFYESGRKVITVFTHFVNWITHMDSVCFVEIRRYNWFHWLSKEQQQYTLDIITFWNIIIDFSSNGATQKKTKTKNSCCQSKSSVILRFY